MGGTASEYDDSYKTMFGASVADIKAGFRSANISGKDNNAYTLGVHFIDAFESGSTQLLNDSAYLDALTSLKSN
jgi:hypothetical protein